MGAANYEPIPIQEESETRNNISEENIELLIQIDELLEPQRSASESSDASRNSISKVPRHMYQGKTDDKLFEPQVVSIGPYHRGKAHLKAMEEHKMLYLIQLLKRTKEDTVQSYVEELKKREQRARECYAAPIDNISPGEFVNMMLLDGCFIIEVIRYTQIEELKSVNSHPLTTFTLERVKRDLLLLENQLPFFILWDLFFLTRTPLDKGESFISMATSFLSKENQLISLRCNADPYSDVKHLLGLQYQVWIPSGEGKKLRPRTNLQHHVKMLKEKSRDILTFYHKKRPDHGEYFAQLIPSATQLKATGINFKRFEPSSENNGYSLFHVNFEKGVFWIPQLVVNYDTESTFRNLVAYEQAGYKHISSMPVTYYLVLMDCLIDTGADVELLVDSGIVFNWLGDHEEVALLFNRVSRSLLLGDVHDFFYNEIFEKVEQYYYKNWYYRKWNRWMADLRQKYFNTPWTFISFLAAVFLLALTTVQTVYSVK